jgi:hypothetical protein
MPSCSNPVICRYDCCYVNVSGHRITKVRPIIIDGEHMIVTMDFRQDRVNVELADGRVVRIVKAM